MKKIIIVLVALQLLGTSNIFSQDKRALKAADISFNSGQRDYKKGNYKEASKMFEVVVSTIPASIDSKKHLEMRLDALINLVDIYFYKSVNITEACKYLDLYQNDVQSISNSGVLKASALAKYLKQKQDFATKESTQCKGYKSVGGDMDKFKKTFDKEFE